MSTIAPGSSSKKLNETTDRVFDDETPAIARQTQNNLPPAVSFSIIGVLAAGLITTIAVIHTETDATPAGVMTPQQHAQYLAKKNALAYAHKLLVKGRYDESVQAYDDFLRIYPKSIAGQQGRVAAGKASEDHKPKSSVIAEASKTTKKPPPKPNFWQRMLHRNKPK